MINLLDQKRDWFKSCIGLPRTESAAATSFCKATFHTEDDLIEIEDITADHRFTAHTFGAGAPFVRFYAAARLAIDGQMIGTICAYDLKLHAVSAEQLGQLLRRATAAVGAVRQRAAVA